MKRFLCLAFLLVLSLALAACDGDDNGDETTGADEEITEEDLEGTYVCEDGTTVELRDDGTFAITTPEGETVEDGLTYEVEGDVITYIIPGEEPGTGTIENGSVTDPDGQVCEKQ